MVTKVALAALVLTLGSCGVSPLYERATIKPGVSTTVGLGVVTLYDGEPVSGSWPDVPFRGVALYPCIAGIGTLHAEFGVGSPDSNGNVKGAVLVQGSYGTGKWLQEDNPGRAPRIYEVTVGGKARIGGSTAVRMTYGWPYLVDLMLIQDVGRHVTCSIGGGFKGLTAGLTGHLPLSGHVAVHPSLSATLSPRWDYGTKPVPTWYAGIGLGVE